MTGKRPDSFVPTGLKSTYLEPSLTSSSAAAREEEKNEPSDTEEADEPAPAPALAEQKTFDSVPEEEKVWVLGYRLDNIFS